MSKRAHMDDTNDKGPSDTINSVIDAGPDINFPTQTDVRVFEYSGTTWLNNNDNTQAPNSNVWTAFPWEYIQLFLLDAIRNNVIHEYQRWKPIDVSVEIMNPTAVQEINTGTTPTIVPQPNAKLYGVVDYGYKQEVNSQIMASQTSAQVQTIINSWSNSGYTGSAVTYLPNQQINPGSFNTKENNAECKIISCQNGQSFNFNWKFHNHFWRSTTEFASQAISQQVNECFGCRTDELLGAINRNFAIVTGIPLFGYPPGLDQPVLGQNFSPTSTNAFFNTGEFMQIWSDHTPQPKLLLHLQPQFGAFGSAGPISCQIDFKIKFKVLCTGKINTEINKSITNNISLIINPAPPTMAGNIPLFIPIATL